MNTMMLALLQGRLRDAAARLQERLGSTGDEVAACQLAEAMQALEALRLGRYGLCVGCDAAIEVDRLLRKPYRLTCADCEAASEAMSEAMSETAIEPAGAAKSVAQTGGARLDAYTVEGWKYSISNPAAPQARPQTR